MTKIVHCKLEPYDVYIGRPSIFGNPFEIGKDGNRTEVIAKFEQYLKSNEFLMKEIQKLRGKTLACWCKPKACHGDVIVRLLDNPSLFDD